MCGRYTLRAKTSDIRAAFGVETLLPLFEPRYNVAPTQEVLIVREVPGGEKREPVLVRWGLIPKWAPDEKIGNRLINARSETVFEKRSFKSAVLKRRCLVVADGWYEWQKQGERKQPYLFQFPDRRPFAFAGLWERWDRGDKPLETCTILTTDAAEFAADVHDRMPLVLDPAFYDRWLDPTLQEPERITPLMTPYRTDGFERIPVSNYVNCPRNQGPQCAEPM